MFIRRVGNALSRVAHNPLTARAVKGARVVADVAGYMGVPAAAGIAKGLGAVEKALKEVQAA